MSRRQFSPPEREGIWVAHDEVCWLCKRPVGFTEMHIEHLIPVDLKNDPDALIELKRKLGLPPDFEIKSFENWRPAHSDCNLRKSGIATDAPFVGIEIERGRARAAKANELAKEIRSSALLSRAVAKVASACFHDQLTPNQIDYLTDAIPEFSTFHLAQRPPERQRDEINLGFGYLVDDGRLRVVEQPYGIGVGPTGPEIAVHMRCPSCGNPYFNGARCTLCGTMDDD